MAQFSQIKANAAGIDLGSRVVFIALSDGTVKSFETFTAGLLSAVNFLKQNKVETAAMESTGVYGVVLFDMIEEAGIEIFLVNPAHLKYVPGRKTDVQDCQWIQQLHSYGLLKPSFVPQASIKILRSYLRIREQHVKDGASCIQRMQKALTMMNLMLHNVISRLNSVSGMRVLKAILEGQRDPETLLSLCDKSIIKNKRDQVLAALQGNHKDEHLFALKQALDCYEFYQVKMAECDQKIDEQMAAINKDKTEPEQLGKAKKIRNNQPQIEDYHKKMVTVMDGKDLTILPGITDYNLLQLIGEIGTDLTKWPTEKHFTSWLGLSPGKNSSGKLIKQSKKKAKPKAGGVFREAARSILQSKKIALGHFARRIRAKKGSYIAIKATARKLAELYYRTATKGTEYVEQGIEKYEQKIQETQMRILMKKAYELNMMVVPVEQ
jgi:transposase